TFNEYWRFRRVQVFRRRLGAERARAEADRPPLDVANREDDPIHEVVARPALTVADQARLARRLQVGLLPREPAQERLPRGRRVPETEAGDRFLLEPAARKVGAGVGLPGQLLLVEAGRQRVHLEEALAFRGALLRLAAPLVRQAELAGEPLQRFRKRE